MSDFGLAPADHRVSAYLDAFVKFYANKHGLITPDELTRRRDERGLEDLRKQALIVLHSDLYANLDTLDAKASGLLAYCGLVLMASAIILSINNLQSYHALATFLVVVSTFCSLLILPVIYIRWTSADRMEQKTLESACRQYYKIREVRAKLYRISHGIIFLATFLIFIYFFVSIFL